MRLKIHKKIKKSFILILILLTFLSGLQLFLMFSFPQKNMTEIIQYEATLQPALNYSVQINPNEVFPGTSQEEGKMYSKKVLNNILVDFAVDYSGSKKVPLDIEYQLYATVNGYQGKEQEKTIYWSKMFPITAQKALTEKNGIWNKKERASITLSGYDAFSVRAKEITGMDVANELLISMAGKVIAHTGKEDMETPFDIYLKIPLMEDTFQITKCSLDPIKNSITEKVESEAPTNKVTVIAYGALLAACIFGFILLIFFTREPNLQELLAKKVNSTLKNYGSRIVALQDTPKMNYRQHYKVHSMKDMIKIADELQKPIFYKVDRETIVKDYEFHIIEEDTVYSFFLDSAEA